MFSRIMTKRSTAAPSAQIERLKEALASADAVVIGAGAGLSTSAAFIPTPPLRNIGPIGAVIFG